MSIYIGQNRIISKEDIVAILDSKSILESETNKNFIKGLEKDSVIRLFDGQVKTYILTQYEDSVKLYESSISSTSIEKKFKMKGLKNIDE